MHHFRKIAGGVEVAPINAQLAAHPELWDAHSIRKTAPGSPHRAMSDIWVRYNDAAPFLASGDWRRFNDPHIPIWYPAWNAIPALRPIVHGLAALVRAEMIGGILITRIPPGEGIAPHTDAGWHVDYFDKFYLSLASAPGASFGCDADGVTELLHPAPGEIWRFDNRRRHWVENNSDQDRVTAIICLRTHQFQEHP